VGSVVGVWDGIAARVALIPASTVALTLAVGIAIGVGVGVGVGCSSCASLGGVGSISVVGMVA